MTGLFLIIITTCVKVIMMNSVLADEVFLASLAMGAKVQEDLLES